MHADCSTEIKELAKAPLNVQRKIQPASKAAMNPFTKSKYATLNSVMSASPEALLENSIWLCQYPVPVEAQGCIGLASKLTHVESRQWQSSLAVIPLPKADPQGMGSALTYAGRYGLPVMLGMVTEDDGGEAACGRKGASSRQESPRRQAANRQDVTIPHQAEEDGLPHLEGIAWQRMAAQDGRECIVASGNDPSPKNWSIEKFVCLAQEHSYETESIQRRAEQRDLAPGRGRYTGSGLMA